MCIYYSAMLLILLLRLCSWYFSCKNICGVLYNSLYYVSCSIDFVVTLFGNNKGFMHVIPYVCIICVLMLVGKLNASLTVENVTSSSVEVYYLISPLLLEVSDLIFSIRYNTTTSPTQSSQNFTIFDTDGVVQLVNLSPNTEYLLWMMAEASDGITVTSEVTSFKTMLAGKSSRPVESTSMYFDCLCIVIRTYN